MRLRLLPGLPVVLELLLRAEERRDQAACQVGRVGQGDGSSKVGRGAELNEGEMLVLIE